MKVRKLLQYLDFRTLPSQNGMHSSDKDAYLSIIICICFACLAMAYPELLCNTRISLLSKSLSDMLVVCHFYFDEVFFFYRMDCIVPTSAEQSVN